MKNKYIVVSTIALLIQASSVSAYETSKPGTLSADSSMMNDAHSAAVHGSSEQHTEQPFWSEDQGKQAEREAQYKKQIAENPENPSTYAYLAGLYLTNNKTAEAIDAYQDAITHNPKNAKLFAAISIAYLHQSKFDMAKAMTDEALRLDPSLKQVEKINQYIEAKQEAIKSASSVSQEEVNNAKTGSGLNLMQAMPVDAVHGNSDALRNKNLSEWTETSK